MGPNLGRWWRRCFPFEEQKGDLGRAPPLRNTIFTRQTTVPKGILYGPKLPMQHQPCSLFWDQGPCATGARRIPALTGPSHFSKVDFGTSHAPTKQLPTKNVYPPNKNRPFGTRHPVAWSHVLRERRRSLIAPIRPMGREALLCGLRLAANALVEAAPIPGSVVFGGPPK